MAHKFEQHWVKRAGLKGGGDEFIYLAAGKDDLEFIDRYCNAHFNVSGRRDRKYDKENGEFSNGLISYELVPNQR